jgi:tetratricopeptide (TPR) repeat protein
VDRFQRSAGGPTGTGLLRLLYGLRGSALTDDAVRLAATYDDAVKRALAKVAAARANGDPDTLVELAQSGAPEWTTTTMLLCKVAAALIALKKPDEAVNILDALIQKFPRSIRPQQLKGLALATQGNWRGAQQILGELYELGERDPETLNILARTWRDRFAQSGDRLHLRKARNLFAEAFNSTPSDYSAGENAAVTSVVLDEPDDAHRYAAAVERLVGTQPVRGDYRRTATIAEVQLLRGRFGDAAKLYAAAVEDDPEAKGDHDSTLSQARLLMDKLKPTPEERAAVEKAFVG